MNPVVEVIHFVSFIGTWKTAIFQHLPKKKIIKNWLVRVYGSPQAFREIPVRNNTYSELQLKK